MRLSLTIPRFADSALLNIAQVHAAEGSEVLPGTALMDIRVDLSGAVALDCPPVSLFRIVSLERAWVRRVEVMPHTEVQPGSTAALLTTGPEESSDGPPGRALRVSTVSILNTPDWLGEG